MKIAQQLLSDEEKKILAEGFNSEWWPVYSKVLRNCAANLAQINMAERDMRLNDENRGKFAQIQWELSQMKRNYLEVDRAKRKKQLEKKK